MKNQLRVNGFVFAIDVTFAIFFNFPAVDCVDVVFAEKFFKVSAELVAFGKCGFNSLEICFRDIAHIVRVFFEGLLVFVAIAVVRPALPYLPRSRSYAAGRIRRRTVPR